MGHETKSANEPSLLLAWWRLHQEIFRSPGGILLLEGWERRCQFHETAFIPKSRRLTDFRLGQHDFILSIHRQLQMPEDRIAQLAARDIANEAAQLDAMRRPGAADDFLFPQKGEAHGKE
jgi:hypothetical protein